MADITGPIYIKKQGLCTSQTSLSISGHAFSALGVWHRSAAFEHKQLIFCTFDVDIAQANSQIAHMRMFLLTCSSQPASIDMEICYMTYLDINQLLPLIGAADRAGCKSFEVDAKAPASCSDVWSRSRVQLLQIGDLHLNYRRLSPAGWEFLLDSLDAPSLRALTVDGKVPISALTSFLLRHPHIDSLRFKGVSTFPITLTTSSLHLPALRSLRGSLPNVLGFLQCLSSPPSLKSLKINTVTDLPYPTFLHKVRLCLELCRGPIELHIGFHPSEPFKQFTQNLRLITCRRRTRITAELALVSSTCFTVRDISDTTVKVRKIHSIDVYSN